MSLEHVCKLSRVKQAYQEDFHRICEKKNLVVSCIQRVHHNEMHMVIDDA